MVVVMMMMPAMLLWGGCYLWNWWEWNSARRRMLEKKSGRKMRTCVFLSVLSPTVSPFGGRSSDHLPSAMEAV